MGENYTELWKKLNMNLEAHDSLMNVLGKFYSDIYLSQKNRPKSMSYFDYCVSEIHGMRIKELQEAKDKGRKIIGGFCVYVPEELVIAADAIQVGLCAGADVGTEEAETIIPRNTCALVKAFVGFKKTGVCPYIEISDLVVGETTCDGKKKAYELFSEIVPMHIMEVPNMKRESSKKLWKSEVIKFKEVIEEITGNKITADKLKEAIKIVNARRKALERLNTLRGAIPTPISGRDVLLINQLAFLDDPIRFTVKVNNLCDELEERIKNEEGVVLKDTPRVMLSGCPMAVPNWKIHFLTETSGVVIVGEESCVGNRNTQDYTDESGQTVDDMINDIAKRYLNINCACFTPNKERINQITNMAKDLKVNGVIHYTISFCQTYASEVFKIEKALEKINIPFYSIETDYGMEDMEQLKTRLEAFVEMIQSEMATV